MSGPIVLLYKGVPLRDRCSFGRFTWLISQALTVTYVVEEHRLYLERNCRLPESGPQETAESRGACQSAPGVQLGRGVRPSSAGSRSSSSTSRNESEYRRYQRTAHRISPGSVCRHLNIAGRIAFFMISSGYQPPSGTVATQPYGEVARAHEHPIERRHKLRAQRSEGGRRPDRERQHSGDERDDSQARDDEDRIVDVEAENLNVVLTQLVVDRRDLSHRVSSAGWPPPRMCPGRGRRPRYSSDQTIAVDQAPITGGRRWRISRRTEALLHESSLACTMPTDRILTGRCDMTLVGRARSSG